MKILLTLCLLVSSSAFAVPRRVEIQVTADGYKPDKITAKPGEQLMLIFKPAASMGCCDSIVVPAANFKGKVEKGGKPLEVPVTMPASGRLAFACSMNMCQGEVAPK